MKKIVKLAAITVAVVLVVLLVAPTLFRGKIESIVKHEANELLAARLDFERLDISLLRHFPHASVDLKGLTLVGWDRFEGDTIVAARRISVVVDLLSLFRDSGFEVTKIILARPELHARKLADGAVNWDVMKPAEEPETEEPEEISEPSAFRLSLKNFTISDAVIRYEDDSTQMRFSTEPLSLRLRGDLSAERTGLDLQLSAKALRFVSGGIPLLSGADAELDASIDADLANNRFTFSDNKFRLNAIELGLDGWVELAENAVKMDVSAGCGQVQFKDILSLIPAFYTRDFRNLTAGGSLSMGLWARGELSGRNLPAFELKTGVQNGSFQYSSLPKAVTDINIAARIANPGGTMDKTEVDLSQFGLRMAGNALSATLYATNLASDPSFRASANGKVDLGAVKEVYPLEKDMSLNGLITADVKVSGRMSAIDKKQYEKLGASGTFVIEQLALKLAGLPDVRIRRAAATITPSAMTLGDFGATVGRSDISANGQLSGYLGYLLRDATLSGRLYVKSELLDLNEIMAALPQSDESEAPAAEQPAEPSAPVQAIEVPRNLNLSLSTEFNKILFQKMTIAGLTGKMGVANGTLSLDGLKMKLFDGSVAASGSYSTAANPQRPQLKLAAEIAGASFSKTFEQLELIQKLVPIFAKTGGDYSMSLDLATALDNTMSPDLQSLNASGEIRSANIHVQNIGAFDALAKALNNDALKRIEAKDVAIRFAVRDGRITTQPFDLKMGNIKMNLSGSTGLDQSIDYVAKVALPSGATGGVLQNVNVNIGGTFSSPKITLGVKEAAQEAVKNVVDQQIQKLTGSASLSEEVQKQAEKLRVEAEKAGEKLVEAAQKQRQKLIDNAAAKGTLAKIAAEKAGDKLVAEAEKQAEKLKAEAETQIAKLTAGKTQE
ncbi:MAG: AsmA family protein [Alistipes senegalensis]|nr:AsmA family protein [Bacteroides cellulosilyticus]MCM1352268.1 AsmA family protein [Alistipes senegalensis]